MRAWPAEPATRGIRAGIPPAVRPIDYFDRAGPPERPAFIGGGRRYTYAEAREASVRIAAGLYRAGFALGDPVAVFSPNDPAALVCVLGLLRAGGAWIPVNVRNTVPANAAYLRHVGTRWLFYHSSVAAEAAALARELPALAGRVCIDAEDGDAPGLEAFGTDAPVPDWSDPFGAPEHRFALWPTGGTTGAAKVVEISNRAWCVLTELGLRYWDTGEPPVHLVVAPITHAAGGMVMVLSALSATHVVLPRFDAGAVLDAIAAHRVTHLFLPPTAFYALLDHPRVRDADLSSLRQLLLAAAPVSPERLRRGVEVFGPCVCQCYGQTETLMMVAWLSPAEVAAAARGEGAHRLASCGRPTSACRVAILDGDGQALPAGEAGEICVRGATVAPGYFADPEATAEVRAHGWHHTGDVGRFDEDGYLYIVDRLKDMIVTGGFNVYAAEVEAAILALDGVRECAVIGVPDDRWGEAVKALVVPAAGFELAPAAVIDHCRRKLGGVKAPKTVELWPEIPKTPAGKTDKKAIRARYWPAGGRAVH